jgi:hypothetical protein
MHVDQSLSAIWTFLDAYVTEIRNAEFSRDNQIFRKKENKYYLETLVRDLLFRLEAGAYHNDRVIDIVNMRLEELERIKIPEKDLPSDITGKMTFKVSIQCKATIFELIAFLVSIRSMLDSLTKIISVYLKGTKFQSIATLHKYIEKQYLKNEKTVPFEVFTIVNQHWIDWVKYLRDYRGDLVHELTISSSAEHEVRYIPCIQNGKKISKKIEMVTNFFIPKDPKFEYILEGFDQEPPFIESTSIYEQKNADGEVVNREVSIEKKINEDQMIEIKSFVNLYFEKAVVLVTEIIISLRKSRFTYLTLE